MSAYDPSKNQCARCGEWEGVHRLDCPELRTGSMHKHLIAVTLEIYEKTPADAAEQVSALLNALQKLSVTAWSFRSVGSS
jgi:hypothetical protein